MTEPARCTDCGSDIPPGTGRQRRFIGMTQAGVPLVLRWCSVCDESHIRARSRREAADRLATQVRKEH